jgi:hypothetical protein
LPDLIDHKTAQPIALAKAGHLMWMERASNGAFKVCRTVAELRDCWRAAWSSGILHMEGAEAIDPGLDALHVFHAMGLRSLGPVWSRPDGVRPWRALCLPLWPRYRAGADRGGQAAGAGVQPRCASCWT